MYDINNFITDNDINNNILLEAYTLDNSKLLNEQYELPDDLTNEDPDTADETPNEPKPDDPGEDTTDDTGNEDVKDEETEDEDDVTDDSDVLDDPGTETDETTGTDETSIKSPILTHLSETEIQLNKINLRDKFSDLYKKVNSSLNGISKSNFPRVYSEVIDISEKNLYDLMNDIKNYTTLKMASDSYEINSTVFIKQFQRFKAVLKLIRNINDELQKDI